MSFIPRILLVLTLLLSINQVQAQTSSCPTTGVTVDLLTDNYGSETSWQIANDSGQTVASGEGYANNTQFSDTVCLNPGNYVFTLFDSYGDGICCAYGNGSYQLSSDAVTLASGGEFGRSEATPFRLTEPTTPPASCNQNTITITLKTDNYGSESQWSLSGSGGQIASGNGYDNNTEYQETLCLDDGEYTFTITDSYGDGICCAYGQGFYQITQGAELLATGGEFNSQDSVTLTLPNSGNPDTGNYYDSAIGLSGYALKTALFNIINNHTSQGYGALWSFYRNNELDQYYENDNSIIDIYSENPTASDPYNYSPGTDQCGTYNSEADCYNREHSFPRSWFGGSIDPMNSDVHHIFPTDGQVNAWRGSYPYGEVSSATRISANGSKVGTHADGSGYSGTVFEPIDEFKGDLARAQFYMAIRYQDRIGSWQGNSSSSNAVLDGSSDRVFESWYLTLLKSWHAADPVSQKEIDRNQAAEVFQGNRNPFVDHPEWVNDIWGQ